MKYKGHKKKADIRDDWVKTRSLYCYKDSAAKLFKDLLLSLNSRYLLISYNTEGIIPIEQLVSIASEVGRIDVIGNEYVKYRGGKQSISRVNNNFEFLKRKLHLQFKMKYSKVRLKRHFNLLEDDKIEFLNEKARIVLKMISFFYLMEGDLITLINNLEKNERSYNLLKELLGVLKDSQCKDIPKEIDEIIRIVKDSYESRELLSEIPTLLRKVAHKKYREIFYEYVDRIRGVKNP